MDMSITCAPCNTEKATKNECIVCALLPMCALLTVLAWMHIDTPLIPWGTCIVSTLGLLGGKLRVTIWKSFVGTAHHWNSDSKAHLCRPWRSAKTSTAEKALCAWLAMHLASLAVPAAMHYQQTPTKRWLHTSEVSSERIGYSTAPLAYPCACLPHSVYFQCLHQLQRHHGWQRHVVTVFSRFQIRWHIQ